VAGNQAENLLDFDDEPSSNPQDNNTLVSDGMISNKAIASAAKSTNPLDELMDLFSTASMTAPATQPVMNSSDSFDGLGMGMGMSSTPSPVPMAPQVGQGQVQGQKKQDDDLLGLF
jgi:AP-1 complex subunit beta-1